MARPTAAGLQNLSSGTAAGAAAAAAAVTQAENADRSSSSTANPVRPPPAVTAGESSSADTAAAVVAAAVNANTHNGSSSGSSCSSSGGSRSSGSGMQIGITHIAPPGPLVAADTKKRQKTCDGSTRRRLSELLSRNTGVAAGKYACGAKLEPPQRAWFPRIKLKAMPASLSLPLTSREAIRLKESQIDAGQERDVNADGAPETRLPWAVRPGADFKIVNNKLWTSMVVAPVLKKVGGGVVCSGVVRLVCFVCAICLLFCGCASKAGRAHKTRRRAEVNYCRVSGALLLWRDTSGPRVGTCRLHHSSQPYISYVVHACWYYGSQYAGVKLHTVCRAAASAIFCAYIFVCLGCSLAYLVQHY